MILLLFTTFTVTVILQFVWNRLRKYQMRSKMGLKGPPIKFWTGNLKDLQELRIKTNNKTLRGRKQWHTTYGRTFGFYIGPKLCLFSTDLNLAKEVLVKQNANFTDRYHGLVENNEPPTRDSILVQTGTLWKQSRNLVTPAFSGNKMKQMSQIIEEKVQIMVEELEKVEKIGEPFNIYLNFQGLTLDVIGRCAFALDTECQRDFTDPFYLNCQQMILNMNFMSTWTRFLPMLLPELMPMFRLILRLKKVFNVNMAESWLVDKLYRVIEARQKQIKEFTNSTDILQLLLKEKKSSVCKTALEVSLDRDSDKVDSENMNGTNGTAVGVKMPMTTKLSIEQVVGNSYAFLIAGFETTSTALATTSWLIARHQHVQHKLVQEVDRVLADKDTATYDDIKNMPYLDAVFKEGLRFYPPVNYFCARTCIKECNVAGLNFSPEMLTIFPAWQIHHDSEIWENPDEFNPERFVTGQIPSHPMAWIPFGAGPRNCVGMRFADMEFKIALASLLKKFTIHLKSDHEPELEAEENAALSRPEGGVVEVVLRKRE